MGYISKNVIQRLPRYLRKLNEMLSQGINRTSSMEIARELGLTPSLTRQDFSCFGEFGIQGYGYQVASLRDNIRSVLGCDRVYGTVLVGVGNLGCALLENINQFPVKLILQGAFDIREDLIGKTVSGERVLDGSELKAFIQEHAVDIAILAVPRSEAQAVAETVISAGVRAIWNFTNVELAMGGSEVLVENVHFSDSFRVLTYRLAEIDKSREQEPC